MVKPAKPSASKSAKPKKIAKATAAEKSAKSAKSARDAYKVSPLRGMPVAEWIATKVSGWQADTIRRMAGVVAKAAPDATSSIKWSQPVFELNGPFAFVKPAKAHVSFGFWRGAELADPAGLLEKGDRMGHFKVKGPDELDEKKLAALVKEAVALNRAKGDPTKR